MVSFEVKKELFLNELTKGFKSRIDILNQFKLDYPRMKLVIDGVIIKHSIKTVLLYIWILSGKNQNVYYNFLACCTQAIMAYPFEKLSGFLPSFIVGDSPKPLIIMINSKTMKFFVYKVVKLYSVNEKSIVTKELTEYKIEIDFVLNDNNSVKIKYQKNNI
tara:strand:- start:46 stop:528 length:483 start_codon:yes stop_codon:yes gene_type:complete